MYSEPDRLLVEAAFMALMKNVAILLVEKGVKLARLKPETKAAYGLD